MFKEYAAHDATGLAELIARREISAGEVLEAALARAAELNPRINAVCTEMTAIARVRAGEILSGAFAGVPFLIKDYGQDYASVRSTSGSRALREWAPGEHSESVKRFLAAGLVIFGKTATPEFALKALTEPERFGATRNPWDLDRTPGGSSGGSAAAVAAGIVPMAGASDGGGSIRIPAAYCGLFGLRPSRGRVSSAPEGEFWDGASSQHVLSRSVRDSARMLDVLVGPVPGDPFVVAPPEQSYASELSRAPGRLRIGFSTASPIGTEVDAIYVRAVEDTAKLLESLGHHVEPAAPEIDGAELARCFLTMYFGHVAAEIAETRALTGAGADEFELETRALGMLGRALPAGEFVTARKRWSVFARALAAFHQRYDFYLLPSVAQPPSKIGAQEVPAAQRTLLKLVLRLDAGKLLLKSGIVDRFARESLKRVPFTQLSNLTGTPSMSVPLFEAPAEPGGVVLPVGVQFVARYGDEAGLIRLAAQLEEARPWRDRRPTL